MKATTPRQKAIRKAIRILVPLAPYADCAEIYEAARAPHMRDLLPVNAVFLATVAHIRHQYTDYDALMDDGYDQDAARHFVAGDIDEQLRDWGSARGLFDEETGAVVAAEDSR